MTDDRPEPLTDQVRPLSETLPGWTDLSTPERYRRLAQVADGFARIIDGAAEHDEFVEAVLDLRDRANALLNAPGEFVYLGPQECWERNLPLSAVGWRWAGTVGA